MTQARPMTKDPICGMGVDEATSLHAERDGITYYFCSDPCRQKFQAMPAAARIDGTRDGAESSIPTIVGSTRVG